MKINGEKTPIRASAPLDATATATSPSSSVSAVPSLPSLPTATPVPQHQNLAEADHPKAISMVRGLEDHALISWEQSLKPLLKNKNLMIFLDYDGTLTPIVDVPSEAIISNDMRRLVHRVSQKFPTAIVTGRQLSTITDFMKLDNLYYAGSHGFDIKGPGDQQLHQVASEFLPSLQAAYQSLAKSLAHLPGVTLESNTFSVTCHFRQAESGLEVQAEEIIDQEIARHEGRLVKSLGKKVFELRPNLNWHKGKAVEWLSHIIQKQHDTELFPIYIGDDVTDEDALGFLSSSGKGLGISVQCVEAPRPTAASFILFSTEEVRRFLAELASL